MITLTLSKNNAFYSVDTYVYMLRLYMYTYTGICIYLHVCVTLHRDLSTNDTMIRIMIALLHSKPEINVCLSRLRVTRWLYDHRLPDSELQFIRKVKRLLQVHWRQKLSGEVTVSLECAYFSGNHWIMHIRTHIQWHIYIYIIHAAWHTQICIYTFIHICVLM